MEPNREKGASAKRGGKPRIVVFGAGAWGQNHLRVWHRLGHLAAVCDPDPSRLQKVAAELPEVAYFASPQQVWAAAIADAAVIATPAETHAELAQQAMHAGCDVLVEKPMALTVEQGTGLCQMSQALGRILMVGHVVVHHPAFRRLQQMVRAGEIGKVRYIYSNRLSLGRFRTVENSLWSFAPHDLAMILALTQQQPWQVSCQGQGYLHRHIADVTMTTLRFAEPLQAHVFVSWLHPFREQRFVVVGDRQMAVFDDTLPWQQKLMVYPHAVNWLEGQMPVAHRAEGVAVPLTEAEPLQEECQHFLDCIASRQQPLTDGASGLDVLRVLAAAQRSLEQQGQAESPMQAMPASYFVHPSAVVDPGAGIGMGSKIWHFSHVMAGAEIGRGCTLGQNVFVAAKVRIGDGVRVQNNVSVYEGVELEDDVFCGPSVVFTNVINPRSQVPRRDQFRPTRVCRGATLGANCTLVCGVSIGRYAFVAAGAVVTADVADHALVVGVPARQTGWMCACGEKLALSDGRGTCDGCSKRYELQDSQIVELI